MLLQTAMLAGGQVLLKIGMNAYPAWEFSWQCIVHQILPNWWLWGAVILLVGANLFWMWLLKVYPFSVIYPLTSLGFVLGMLSGLFIFHETVDWLQWVGVMLIIGGCFCIVK